MSAHIMFTQSVVLAQGGGGGVISTVGGLSSSVQTLVKGAILTVAAIFILVTLVRTRMAAGAIIVSLIVGGGAVWGVNNIDLLQTKVGNDIKNSMSTSCPAQLRATAAPSAASVCAPPGPAQI
jgi:hypothetical protein